MATTTKKSRQSISYVLPLENSSGGHRLGVNSLAVDPRGVLYSAGRDGLICSWDIGADLSNPKAHGDGRPTLPPTKFREGIQAHNHWINDIALCYSNEAVVSCSSDLKVKLWRPQSTQGSSLIGHHTDYVKCLAAPSVHTDWVVSAGLDRKIRVWDLNTASEKLKMNVQIENDNIQTNLSVYSLAVGMEGSIVASGGPEKVVRLWDVRSGERIGKFIGHTDNIRSILVSEQNGIVVSASTDKTIKFWSIPQNRCLQTLSMHNDSVWSLYSDHPTLDIFYSGDRSGMVVKTDIRNVIDLGDDRSVNNEGLCLNVAQDNEAIHKVMPCGGYIWTASASSGVKRWLDVDTDAELVFPEPPKADRRPRVASSASTRPRGFTASSVGGASVTTHGRTTIPRTALMKMVERSTRSSNVRDPDAVTVYSVTSGRQQSVAETLMETEETPAVPFNERPQEITSSARGLVKHNVLNDRRRCLTVDTEGDVEMWDLITCVPIKNFGKRHIDDVTMEVNTLDQISTWNTVNCQTGRLAVLLEESTCFDSEQYWDEAGIPEHIEAPADQRINLGKWILRYMFGNFLDEQIRRDATYRKTLEASRQERERLKISLPPPPPSNMVDMASPLTTPTVKTPMGGRYGLFPQTPGLGIGVATPMPPMSPWDDADRSSAGRSSGDYFSHAAAGPSERPSSRGRVSGDDSVPSEPVQEKSAGIFGNLKWGGFGGKKLGRSASTDMGAPVNKGAPVTGIPDSSLDIPHAGGIGAGTSGSGSGAAGTDDEEKIKDLYAETIAGVLVRLRTQYDAINTGAITSNLTPSLPAETPFLRLPRGMNIFINEDKPGYAHSVDICSTTVGGCGDKESADELERIAPSWLGELLLHNRCPLKETVKVAFILMPWQEGDGGDVRGNKYTTMPVLLNENGSDSKPARLNANRMLRAKKIRGYVVEHLPPGYSQGEPDLETLVELVCNGTVINPTVTLATIKHYVWKNSNSDVALLYRRRVPPATPTDG